MKNFILSMMSLVVILFSTQGNAQVWIGKGDSRWVSVKGCIAAGYSPCKRIELVKKVDDPKPVNSVSERKANRVETAEVKPAAELMYCNHSGGANGPVSTSCSGSIEDCLKWTSCYAFE